jgi:hypothetical protein
MNESEARIIQSCYIWHHNTYPEKRGLFFKIKNEGTNRITGARDKATGVIPGVADTCLIHEGKAYFFEFKTPTGIQSPVQKSWEKTIKTAGAEYYIVRSLELFQILITDIYA